MAPRRCPICHTREWRKEPGSGLLVCGLGHVLRVLIFFSRNLSAYQTSMLHFQDYIVEVNDAEATAHTLRKRTIKSKRTKKERTSRADPLSAYIHDSTTWIFGHLSFPLPTICPWPSPQPHSEC